MSKATCSTPNEIGAWGSSHGALGINRNPIWDPQHKRMTAGIELHAGGNDADKLYTEGCIALARGDYPRAKALILEMINKHGGATLNVGPEGASITPAEK